MISCHHVPDPPDPREAVTPDHAAGDSEGAGGEHAGHLELSSTQLLLTHHGQLAGGRGRAEGRGPGRGRGRAASQAAAAQAEEEGAMVGDAEDLALHGRRGEAPHPRGAAQGEGRQGLHGGRPEPAGGALPERVRAAARVHHLGGAARGPALRPRQVAQGAVAVQREPGPVRVAGQQRLPVRVPLGQVPHRAALGLPAAARLCAGR